MQKLKKLIAVITLTAGSLTACEELTISAAAEEALEMCRTVALRVIEGSGEVTFPSSFHDPFRDPTVVRLRYTIENSGIRGTVRCYYKEDVEPKEFDRIELDGEDIPHDQLQTLQAAARRALRQNE